MISLYQVLLSSLSQLIKFPVLMLGVSLKALFLFVQMAKPVFPYLFLICSFYIFFLFLRRCFLKPAAAYLVDFPCFKPQSFCREPFSFFLENASKLECFDKERIAFMSKILISSGQSEETYLPPTLHYIPPKTHQQESTKEAQMVLFPVVEDLLAKPKLSPQDIDILIVNCSGFCPSPSLSSAKDSSKYKLFCRVRTPRASVNKAYFGVFREEDSNGKLGVTFTRDLVQAAGETLRSHISYLGWQILPFTEKLCYGVSVIKNRMLYISREIYVPDFKTVIQHFCFPATGLVMIIREISKVLKLNERDMEAALMTLHRFGNQSSSSLWYELSYIEAKERVKKGDKVWQLGWGSGLKCTNLIWECLRTIHGAFQKGPWAGCIHMYPVENIDQGFTKP